METRDLNYGSLRISTPAFLPLEADTFTAYSALGWHECNRLYGISRPNGSDEFLLIFTVSGEGELITEEKTYTLSPSSVAIIMPNVMNEYRTKGDKLWEFYWMHPTGAASERILRYLMQQLKASQAAVASMPVHVYGDIFESILAFENEAQQKMKIFEYVSRILCRLCRDMEESHTPHRRVSEQVMDYIGANYGKKIKIKDIAASSYLSIQHMIKTFREETGYTPHAYLNHVRLSKARELIVFTELPISAVADAVGFAQTSNFIVRYKEKYGVTPGDERKKSLQI